ncbi:alpha/beta hydrolase [Legionella anisa]|uniref:Alpha/beta hydrolase n=1 Tax=Legionella anisa TaxID=28082 RepID=A0AAX0WUN9_9GAMM|nr:alpha/beta hydrolase [Legionella anisa]AWN74359.1 alpha/beta hydrolase [Legionella anisa]KTC71962.1 lipolytic enzyme [Legionella anisa]MBN5935240.1 alpha/beta hydrolase [Legionella anisa]MCW8425544.1 alpha/beta hydrolase [Legionella anisa]MCW8449025.1 alpha/beta hydrolase [Legionella anisa]
MNKVFSFIYVLIAILYCFFSHTALASTIAIPHTKQFISYNDLGEGKPLVLIHAFPTDQRLWQPQQEELKEHFRVITLDLWGFGESSSVDGKAIPMSEYADEVKQLLDYLKIDKAIIGGESMGGYIALAFLDKYPNQTLGLVLSNTQAVADSPETKATREKTALDVLENGPENLISGFIAKALSSTASQQTKDYLRHILSLQKSTAIASALRGMALRNSTSAVLATTKLPILIITGELDNVIPPQQSIDMHSLSKNSQLIILPNAGHLSNLEQPKQWNQAIIEMFA